MPRATRSGRPSQSQTQTQAKRPTKRRVQSSDDEEEDEDPQATQQNDEDEDMEFGGGGSHGKNTNDDDLDRKASDLVRLALFNENKRLPLKREEINKKVMGSSSRAFNAVMEKAQHKLRHIFGMELVELRSRAEREKEANARDAGPADENRKSTGVKKKAVAAGSKSYILRSTLDPLLIEQAVLTDDKILEEEMTEALSDDEEDPFGSIISWTNSDQLGSLGILYVILALILVNGRVMADNDLRAVLKQFNLTPTDHVAFNEKSTHATMPTPAFLSLLSRQGYIESSKIGEQKTSGKRGRATQATQNDETNNVEWKWGGRAHSEVGEKGIAQFVGEFMVGQMGGGEDADDDEGERRNGAIREKRLEVMMKGIQRAAAGGDLSDVK